MGKTDEKGEKYTDSDLGFPANRLILGDNLEILNTMDAESIDLIYGKRRSEAGINALYARLFLKQ